MHSGDKLERLIDEYSYFKAHPFSIIVFSMFFIAAVVVVVVVITQLPILSDVNLSACKLSHFFFQNLLLLVCPFYS